MSISVCISCCSHKKFQPLTLLHPQFHDDRENTQEQCHAHIDALGDNRFHLIIMTSQVNLSDFPPYEYLPLPGESYIRLLRRQKTASQDGILRFTLENRSLDDSTTRYHCLSYTWGNPLAKGVNFREDYEKVDSEYGPSSTVPVIVDNQLLYIQKNLHDALSVVEEDAYQKNLNRATRDKGKTKMHRAAKNGRVGYLQLWATRGADMNLKDDDGRIPLHEAAANGHLDCVEILCQAGSCRLVMDNDGRTPECLARLAEHQHVVDLLQSLASRPDPEPSSIPREIDGPESLAWADAICINQSDIEEKGSQVSMMDRIYSESSYVVAWLGPEDKHLDAGLRALGTLRGHVDQFWESNIQSFNGDDKENYETAGVPLIPRAEWDGLASIYQRQWFRRSWIVQEAVLPDVLIMYCGTKQLDCHDLGTIALALRHNEGKLNTGRSSTYVPMDEVAVSVEWNMAELFRWRENLFHTRYHGTKDEQLAYRKRFNLDQLVRNFGTFLASEAKDRIFSLYGIINTVAEDRLVADYHQSVSTVFTMATRRIIMESGDISLINTWTDMSKRQPGLPSWVPDFNLISGAQVPNYDADKGLVYQGPKPGALDSPYLGVQGILVGKISQAGGRVSTAPGGHFRLDPSWLRMVLSLRKEEGDSKGPETKKEVLSEVLWRTLCMNASPGKFFDQSRYGSQAPDTFGEEFQLLMLLLVFAGLDEKLLQAVGLEAGPEREMFTIIHVDHDPLKDLAGVLDDLDALQEHDGDACVTPPRYLVAEYYSHVRHALIRNSPGRDDGSILEFNVPPGVSEGKDRLVGRGEVSQSSRFFHRCHEFAIAYNRAMGYRQLVIVDKKVLGVASLWAQPGDEVWIVAGIKAPVILRHVPPDSVGAPPRFSFHGKAYVHGMMDGEAVLGRENELQDIELV